MRYLFSLLACVLLTACVDPLADVPVGSGEVYIIHPKSSFQGGLGAPSRGAIPRFCPADENNVVASCLRGTTLPVFGKTVTREVLVDGTPFLVHRTLLPAPGRYAFFRAAIRGTTEVFRSRAVYSVGEGTVAGDLKPNSVMILPVSQTDEEKLLERFAATGNLTPEDLEAAQIPLTGPENVQLAKRAMAGVYGERAASLTYQVAQSWSVRNSTAEGFQLVSRVTQ